MSSSARAVADRTSFQGWRVVRSAAVVWGLQSLVWIQGYGNLAVQLRDQFGWSKTFFSIGFAATRAESALLGPPQGVALRRWGVTAMMRLGAVLMQIGYIGMALMQTRTHFLFALLFIALGSTFSGFLTITSAMVSWFERKRARALSYASMGFAIGGLCGPIMVLLFNAIGWRWTLAIAGTILSALAWAAAPIIGLSREELEEHRDGIDPSVAAAMPSAEGVQANDFTAKEALRTRAFWMIALGHGSALLVVSSVMSHLQLFLTEDLDYSAQGAAVVAGMVPLLQLVGTGLGGPLGDRFNKRAIASVAMLGHGIGLLLLTYAQNLWMIAGFIVLHGLAWGTRGPQMNALRADYFGTTSFGTIMGFSALITTIGAMAGPLLAGALADATGDYRLGFTLLAAGTMLGLVFFVLATPPTTRIERPQ